MSRVTLVGITQPAPGASGCDTASQLVNFAARVSNPTNQISNKPADKLMQYLIEHEHWSPFEMVSMTMEIVTTRDISRQILRHRSFSFQEFSQRYAVSEHFITDRELRLQDTKNRQNSVVSKDKDLSEWWKEAQKYIAETAHWLYRQGLDKGVAKEQARALLPEGLTETTLYMAGTLRSWIHYCQLRTKNGTQKEHIIIANACWNIICENFPTVKQTFNNMIEEKNEQQ